MKRLCYVIVMLAIFVIASFTATADDVTFSGYTYYANGTPVLGANVTIEVWSSDPDWALNASHSNLSAADGSFSVTFDDSAPLDLVNDEASIKFVPRKFDGSGNVQYIGAILNDFPFKEMDPTGPFPLLNITNFKFYLKGGITLNITATGPREKFFEANTTYFNNTLNGGSFIDNGLVWDNFIKNFIYLNIDSWLIVVIIVNKNFGNFI